MRFRKSKWLILLIIPVAVVIGLATVGGDPEPEPAYNGKSLSTWLVDYDLGDHAPAKKQEAEAAVRAIGKKAIPHLTRWVDYQQSQVSTWVNTVAFALRAIFKRPMRGDEMYASKLVSIWGFKILGAEAASAVPDLKKTLRTGDVENAALAAESLIYIGEPAAPALNTLLADPDLAVRRAATNAMNAIADRAADKIPIPE